MKIIFLTITSLYILSFIKNTYLLVQKNKLQYAIEQRKNLTISKNKVLNMDNDVDFINYIIITEYFKYKDTFVENSPPELIKCLNALTNISNSQTFLLEKRKELIKKIKDRKKVLIVKIITAVIVIFSAIMFI